MSDTGVAAADSIAWAGAVLSADTQFVASVPGGVHIGAAPRGVAFPVCALWVQDAPEYRTGIGANRIWTNPTLMVKISAPQDNFAAVRAAASRAHALLDKQMGEAEGSTVIGCVMRRGFPLPEPALINGQQWISFVQLYELYVQ